MLATRVPLRDLVGGTLEWAEGVGPLGAVVVASLFVPASLLLIPGTLIGVACGFAFGFLPAFLAVVVFSNLGAQAAFLVGRRVFHRRVAAWVEADPRRVAVERAVSDQGFRVILLLRLSPLLPYNVLNYALSVSRVRFSAYAGATFLGMLPGTALNLSAAAALGRAGREWTDGVDTGSWGLLWLGLRVVAAVLAVVLVAQRARRLLAEAMAEA